MDKLISLQSVITILENKRFEAGKDLAKSYLLADVQEQIERLPIAFDEEKVIEELRQEAMYALGFRESKFNFDEGEYSSYSSISFSQAKKIIEKGGV